MQRSASWFIVVSVLLVAIFLVGCGGSEPGITNNKVASIVVSPTVASLNRGDVGQLTVRALDSNSATVLADFTYASSNTAVATVSTSGNLCAGTWDANFIVCTPATTIGTSDLTVTSQGITVHVPVFVHEHVDSVTLVPPAAGCVSMGDTSQYSVKAFSRDAAACARLGAAVPCELPASTLGPADFLSTDSGVVSFDNTPTVIRGVATAGVPGRTNVFATLSNNHSPSAPFTTCPVTSLSITVQNSTADPFALDKGATKTLVATVKDSAGKTLDASVINATTTLPTNNPPIGWFTSQPFAMATALAATTNNTNLTVTAASPGTSTLMAGCASPYCNRNLQPVYSNLIVGTTNGTATGVVYAASTTSKTVIPIDMATNTPGTAITLAVVPNSMGVTTTGSKVVFGSANGVTIIDTATAVPTTLGLIGRLLALSEDGTRAAFTNAAGNSVLLLDVTNNSNLGTFVVPGGATAGDFTPDGRYFLAVGNNTFYVFNTAIGAIETTVGTTGTDLAVLPQGSVALFGIPGQIQARALCDSTLLATPAATNPTLIKAVPNGSGALVYDNGSVVRLSGVTVDQACPPAFTQTRSVVDVHGGSANARQLLITPDSKIAFITTDTGKVLAYDLTSGNATVISLTSAPAEAFMEATSLDGKMLYVGAKDGKIHRIDTTTLTDVQQIDPALKQTDGTTVALPDLVGIRNK